VGLVSVGIDGHACAPERRSRSQRLTDSGRRWAGGTTPGLGSCVHPGPKKSCQVASGTGHAAVEPREDLEHPGSPGHPEEPSLSRAELDVAADHARVVRLHSDSMTSDAAPVEHVRSEASFTDALSVNSGRLRSGASRLLARSPDRRSSRHRRQRSWWWRHTLDGRSLDVDDPPGRGDGRICRSSRAHPRQRLTGKPDSSAQESTVRSRDRDRADTMRLTGRRNVKSRLATAAALRAVALRAVALRAVALRAVALRAVALRAVALRAVALGATLAAVAGCNGFVHSAPASVSAGAARSTPGPAVGVVAQVEASRHVDPSVRARCAQDKVVGQWPVIATAVSTRGAVRAAMIAQFGAEGARLVPGGLSGDVVDLCLVKPSPITGLTGEPVPSTLLLALGSDGSSWWAGGQVAPAG
jgi:hypothetical protein